MLITFEGCEGCGKSTQSTLLKEYLTETNQAFIYAREPGGTEISEKIRSVILDKENSAMTAECEALLYAASRAQLIKQVILPSLKEGKIVILDRYIDSSLAYQAYARELTYDFVAKVNSYAMENCMPDVTIFLDVPPEKAFLRKGGADKSDRMELESLQFHNKVYEGYLKLAEMFPNRFVRFADCGGVEHMHALIIEFLRQKGYIK